jgi:hypothetical protein
LLYYLTHSLTNRVELLSISETIKSIKVNMDLCGVNVKNNLLYPTNSFYSGTTRSSSFYNAAEIINCKQQQQHFQRRRIPFLVVTANAGGKKNKKNNNHGGGGGGGGMYTLHFLLSLTAFALLFILVSNSLSINLQTNFTMLLKHSVNVIMLLIYCFTSIAACCVVD